MRLLRPPRPKLVSCGGVVSRGSAGGAASGFRFRVTAGILQWSWTPDISNAVSFPSVVVCRFTLLISSVVAVNVGARTDVAWTAVRQTRSVVTVVQIEHIKNMTNQKNRRGGNVCSLKQQQSTVTSG